jgi:hypothetical protein
MVEEEFYYYTSQPSNKAHSLLFTFDGELQKDGLKGRKAPRAETVTLLRNYSLFLITSKYRFDVGYVYIVLPRIF